MPDYDILCVGEVNIDLILRGLERLPALGEEVLAQGLGIHLGGSTANVALFAARLGLRTALRARVGKDDFGDFLVTELARGGVATDLILRDDHLSTGITVSLSGPTDRAFVTYTGTIDSLTGADVPDTLLRTARHLHIGSFFLQRKLQPDVPQILARAQQLGLTTSLDTGYDPAEMWDGGIQEALRHVDLFLPNEVEARGIAGTADPRAAARALALTARQVALKLGPEGSMLFTRSAELAVPAFQVDLVDTTCCGDAFNAGFLCAMLHGKDSRSCLSWGNAAGAIVAGGSGACAARLSRQAVEALCKA